RRQSEQPISVISTDGRGTPVGASPSIWLVRTLHPPTSPSKGPRKPRQLWALGLFFWSFPGDGPAFILALCDFLPRPSVVSCACFLLPRENFHEDPGREDPNYSVGRHRDPHHLCGRADRAKPKQGGSRPTQQRAQPQPGKPQLCEPDQG